jgi:hypothetical protein
MKCVITIFFIALLLTCLCFGTGNNHYPVDENILDFLNRLVSISGNPGINLMDRPFSRQEIRELLAGIDNTSLNTFEKAQVQRLKQDLAELDTTWGREKHIYTQKSRYATAYLDLNLGLWGGIDDTISGNAILDSTETPGTQKRWGGRYGAALQGALGESFCFYSDFTIEKESSNYTRFFYDYNDTIRTYPINPEHGERKGEPAKGAIWDYVNAYVSYANRYFYASFGLDRADWGPLKSLGLGLSNHAPAYPMLRLKTSLKDFHFTYLTGKLTGLFFDSRKYMAAHRLDWVRKRFQVGLYETIIWGNREYDITYAIPVMPFFFAEHRNGDRDNVSMGLDAAWYPLKRSRIYGQLFLDDLLSPSDFFSDWWANKWAFTLGGDYYGLPLDLEGGLRYTRIEPWVYTHHLGENLRYKHFNAPLGHFMGPDADITHMELRWPYRRHCRAVLGFEKRRKGDFSIDSTYTSGTDNNKKEFLRDIDYEENIFFLKARHEIFRDFFAWMDTRLYSSPGSIPGREEGFNYSLMSGINFDW